MKDLFNKLKQYNQEHLLNFIDELSDEEKDPLLAQINQIDFELMAELKNNIGKTKEIKNISDMASFTSNEKYYEVGLDSVKRGEYALVTMAGGQGTRLGFDGPKGSFVLAYGIDKSLFEIQCDKLKSLYNVTNVYIPWYIMTSYANHEATITFFEDNNYFGYPKDLISFFPQKELPMVSSDGKILMDSKSNIIMGANGHGGVFEALVESNSLADMNKKGIKWVFIGGIDNVLLPVDNPDLIGFAIVKEYAIVSKIVEKAYPDEKVGVFCKKDDYPSVIEYIDMTPEMNQMRYKDGRLVYGDAHILCNLFNISVLDSIAKENLPYIGAYKKANHIDELGNKLISETPNAYKFETFIFDAFSYVNDLGLLKGKREEIFAPIKNATGSDSPETASLLYLNYYKNKQ